MTVNIEDYRDQGYQNTWDIDQLEAALSRILGSLGNSCATTPVQTKLPSDTSDRFRLAHSIIADGESCDPMALLTLAVCDSTPVALAARRALVLYPSILEKPYSSPLAAEALALMPGGLTHLIRLCRDILRNCGKIEKFPTHVLQHLSIALRKNSCLVDNEETAADRPLTDEEMNVHEIACILELPAAARVAVPLLLRLPLALRRIHAASFWSTWKSFRSFPEIKKEILQLDPALANFLKDRFDV